MSQGRNLVILVQIINQKSSKSIIWENLSFVEIERQFRENRISM